MFGRPISSVASRRAVWKAVSSAESALPRYDYESKILLGAKNCDWVGIPPGNAAWPATGIYQWMIRINGPGGNDLQELNVFARMVRTVFRSPFKSA